MQESALLSVIIPIYNGELYLEQTIESILQASWKELELLLIDDGSRDGSSLICRKYEQADKRVHYIRTENHGIVQARNRGLEEAQGKYVCFCDQDDLVDAQMYSNLLAHMMMENADIGMCSTGRLLGEKKLPYETLQNGIYKKEQIIQDLLYPLLFRGYQYSFVQDNIYIYGTVWKCIFRRSFLDKNELWFCKFIDYEDDWIMVTRALAYAACVITSDRVGYYWRVNHTSSSHKKSFYEDLPERLQQYDKYIYSYLENVIADEKIWKEYRKINLCEHCIDMIRNAENASERGEAEKMIQQYLQETDYNRLLSGKEWRHSGTIRYRSVLAVLDLLGIRAAIKVSKIITALEQQADKQLLLAWLERWQKKR